MRQCDIDSGCSVSPISSRNFSCYVRLVQVPRVIYHRWKRQVSIWHRFLLIRLISACRGLTQRSAIGMLGNIAGTLLSLVPGLYVHCQTPLVILSRRVLENVSVRLGPRMHLLWHTGCASDLLEGNAGSIIKSATGPSFSNGNPTASIYLRCLELWSRRVSDRRFSMFRPSHGHVLCPLARSSPFRSAILFACPSFIPSLFVVLRIRCSIDCQQMQRTMRTERSIQYRLRLIEPGRYRTGERESD